MRASSNTKCSILIICFFSMGIFSSPLRAQDPHSELWSSFTTQKYIKKGGFWLRNDLSIRTSFEDDFNVLFLERPRAIFDLGGIIDIHLAVDFRYTRYEESLNTFEIRPWEGVQAHWPDIGRVKFDFLYRFEQRFEWTEDIGRDTIELRSRIRLRATIPLNNPGMTDHTYFTNLSAEAFVPHYETLDESFASTFRLGFTLGYNRDIKWRYQIDFYVDRGRNSTEDNAEETRFIFEAKARMAF
jgi:hypothetical protein